MRMYLQREDSLRENTTEIFSPSPEYERSRSTKTLKKRKPRLPYLLITLTQIHSASWFKEGDCKIIKTCEHGLCAKMMHDVAQESLDNGELYRPSDN